MENFVYNDKFYGELTELSEELFETEKEVYNLPDDWTIRVEKSRKEPIIKFDIDWLMDRIDEERFTEDGSDFDYTADLLCENINFDEINSKMKELYYPIGVYINITKQDLIDNL